MWTCSVSLKTSFNEPLHLSWGETLHILQATTFIHFVNIENYLNSLGHWRNSWGGTSPFTMHGIYSWTRATSCCHTQEAAEKCQAPQAKRQLTATEGLFNSAFCAVPWPTVQLTEPGRVKRQHHSGVISCTHLWATAWADSTVTLETPWSGTLTAPSNPACSVIISPLSLLSW